MSDSIDGKLVSDYTLAELWSFLEETLRHLQAEHNIPGSELVLIECIAHEAFRRAR